MTMQKQEVLQTTKFGIAINKWRILMMIVFAILACSGINKWSSSYSNK